jgi:hypothetical protein
MPDRRNVLSSVGALAVATPAGRQGLRGTRSGTAHTLGEGETGQQAADAALADRLLDGVAAAEETVASVDTGAYEQFVTGEEVVELYGEYWDGRGFLTRMESRFADFGPALDSQTRSAVSEALGILRTEMETTQPPSDVAGTVEALHDMLEEVARA